MKPEAHVPGAGRLRTDLVTWIFEVYLVFLQMRERSSQRRHVRKVERHVIKCFRRGLPLVERDGDIGVAHGDTAIELKFLCQSQRALKPFRALLWVAHCQSKMTNHTQRKWSLHLAH